MFREKEKAEIKDRKVLEILQMKDEKIDELQALLTSRARELEDSINRWVKHDTKIKLFQCDFPFLLNHQY